MHFKNSLGDSDKGEDTPNPVREIQGSRVYKKEVKWHALFLT